jgi:hypothetical protein
MVIKSDHESTETEREVESARHTVMTLYFDHNIGIFYLGFSRLGLYVMPNLSTLEYPWYILGNDSDF